jgi:hypothetical protein
MKRRGPELEQRLLVGHQFHKKKTGASNHVASAGAQFSSDIAVDELGLSNVDRTAVCGDPCTSVGVEADAQVVRTAPAAPTTCQVPDLYPPPA